MKKKVHNPLMDLSYYRASNLINNSVDRMKTKAPGRTMPGIIRPSERVVLPGKLSSFEALSLFTVALYYWSYDDIVLSEIFNTLIATARQFNYQGNWKHFLELAILNNVEADNPLLHVNKGQFNELFAIPEYFEYLEDHFSEDDIFGNIIPKGIKIIRACKYKTRFESEKKSKVNTPQRKRGYTDHGHLPAYDSHARQQANVDSSRKFSVRFDSTNQIHVLNPHKNLTPLLEKQQEEEIRKIRKEQEKEWADD